MEQALMNRLKEELGYDARFHLADPEPGGILSRDDAIYFCGTFRYRADFGDLSENELDHVFLYCPALSESPDSDFHPNPEEIEDLRWVTLEELSNWMTASPGDFSAWFKPACELVCRVLCRQADSRITSETPEPR